MTTGEIASRFEPSEEARGVFESSSAAPPADTARKLAGEGHYIDAVRLIAYSLPKRQAVWWACQFIRRTYGDQIKGPPADAVAAAEKWIADPSEANRNAAKSAADAAGLSTPAGMAGLAVFFAEGMGPDPKAQNMTNACVAASVLGACARDRELEKVHAAFAQAASFGAEVVEKTNRPR